MSFKLLKTGQVMMTKNNIISTLTYSHLLPWERDFLCEHTWLVIPKSPDSSIIKLNTHSQLNRHFTAATPTMAPYLSTIPTDLVDSLGCTSPHDALLALADESEQMAAKLAEELAVSLSGGSSSSDGSGSKIGKSPSKQRKSKLTIDGGGGGSQKAFPIPLPKSLRDAPRRAASLMVKRGVCLCRCRLWRC